jgi:CyaY protein
MKDTQSMTETEFLHQVKAVWQQVESMVDTWSDQGTDVESNQMGPVLEIEFSSAKLGNLAKSSKKIVINPQTPLQQIWLASPAQAYHFRWQEEAWKDTRQGLDFWEVLQQEAKLLTTDPKA